MNNGHIVVGIISIFVSLALLALTAVWASMPSAKRAVTPAPHRPGKRYRCYCWKEPVVVFIEAPPVPTVEAPPKMTPQVPQSGGRPAPNIPPRTQRGRHAKPPTTDHAARPDTAPLVEADGGGRGASRVHAFV